MPARGPCHGQCGRKSPSPLGPCVHAAGGLAAHLASGRAPAALGGGVGGVEVLGERAKPSRLRQPLVGGGGDMVVEARAKAGVYNQRPGRVWGTVGDRDKRLHVWDGALVGG